MDEYVKYYFELIEVKANDMAIFVIISADKYKKGNNNEYDCGISEDDLPNGFEDGCEPAHFSYNNYSINDAKAGRQLLLSQGFVEKKLVNRFLNKYSQYKEALANYCASCGKSYFDAFYCSPITNTEFSHACNPNNWETQCENYVKGMTPAVIAQCDLDHLHFEDAEEDFTYRFDCDHFDGELKGFVKVDEKGNIIDVSIEIS